MTALTLVFLYVPLAVVFVYSLNNSNSLTAFHGVGLRWFRTLFADHAMLVSLWVSLQIAVVATAGSVVLGTMLAFGIHRGLKSLGRPVNATVFLRIVTPETATGRGDAADVHPAWHHLVDGHGHHQPHRDVHRRS